MQEKETGVFNEEEIENKEENLEIEDINKEETGVNETENKESNKERKKRLKLEKEQAKRRETIEKLEQKRKANDEKIVKLEEDKERKVAEYKKYKAEKEAKRRARAQTSKVKILLKILLLIFVGLIVITAQVGTEKEVTGTMNYLTFVEDVNLQKVEKVQMSSDKAKFFTVIYKEGLGLEEQQDEEGNPKELNIQDNKRVEKVINPQTEDFILNLINQGIEIEYIEPTTIMIMMTILLSLLPTLLIFGLIGFYMYRILGNQMGNGSATKGEVTQKEHPVLFEDVAGMTEEKEELLFAIKSLTDDTYKNMGIKPVRGVLLEGPPGVGKTLLAKAVASEAGVNFLSYSGSDFVEMYVGLGANRIRSMYKKAEELEPCIVFIDEIDALGRKRIASTNGGTQESDQTLIALLEKMDGMNTDKKIMFIGATNRSDMLDSALVRPGRFDKVMHIGPPKTKEDREAIVAVHLKGKILEDDVTVEKIAKHCYGLTGAEIASVMNDAVLESIRANRTGIIGLQDIDRATMKLMSKGLAKGRHLADDLERVAVHELGHAIMNMEVGRKVVKVSVQPYSSGVGGVTVIDSESRGISGLRKASDIRNDIKVLYAGKVAEEILLGECSVGASNDLERATLLLREYVGAYGMREGSILSLVGLARENMMISANEKLLNSMEEVGQEIYKEVVGVLSSEDNMNYVIQLTEKLSKEEVIYNFEEEVGKIKIEK